MKNKKMIIWGWGITGQASLNYFLKSKNFEPNDWAIDIYDGNIKENFEIEIINQQPANVKFYFGTNKINNLKSYDLIMASPSIPESHPDIVMARKLGIPIYNDVSYFIHQWKGTGKKLIGVTGSNGKSTVVSLIHGSLVSEGLRSVLVGNIGKSPLDYLLQYENGEIDIDIPVIELSSYQLETFSKNEYADVAVITNISPNHLDHHDNSMEKYVEAKLKILGPNTKLITVLDDPGISKYVLPKVSNPILISIEDLSPEVDKFIDESNRELKGQHNLYNIAIAQEVLNYLKLGGSKSADFIKKYRGLDHRIELVREFQGVKYINDSKSTSPDATRVALETFGNFKNIILIMGGNDKKVSYEMLAEHFNQYVKMVIIFDHEINLKISSLATKFNIPFKIEATLSECVLVAKDTAKRGDIVLFSPGAGSQPKFKNFEDRGTKFKKAVQNIN